MIFIVSFHDTAVSQEQKRSEYEMKAAYLYNFAKFVRWPPEAATDKNESFSICILGEDPFGSALDSLVSGQSIDGNRIAIRHLATFSEANTCRILFVSRSERHRITDVLAGVSRLPVLTVSDVPEFVNRGGTIQFVKQREKVRFEVNLVAAEKSGLTLSSDLLKLAVLVRRNGQQEE